MDSNYSDCYTVKLVIMSMLYQLYKIIVKNMTNMSTNYRLPARFEIASHNFSCVEFQLYIKQYFCNNKLLVFNLGFKKLILIVIF